MGQWVMGHSFDGSHGSWVTARDPFAALVGATFLLSRMPDAMGMHQGLTGANLTGSDVVACGIATHFFRAESIELFKEQLSSVGSG